MESRLKDVRSAALSPLNLVKNLLVPAAEPEAENELEQLRRRVAELEQRQRKPRPREEAPAVLRHALRLRAQDSSAQASVGRRKR